MKSFKKLFFLLLILISFQKGICQYSLPEELISYSILIQSRLGDNEFSGSGFLYSDTTYLYLITARHVVLLEQTNSSTGKADFYLLDTLNISWYPREPDKNNPNSSGINLKGLFNQKEVLFNIDKDIAVIRIGKLSNEGYSHIEYNKNNVVKYTPISRVLHYSPQLIRKFDDAYISNDVFIFGYPKSLALKQNPKYNFNRPLIRKGIIAGKNHDLKSIIIDCPSYGGNSGGAVIEVDPKEQRVYLLGLVIEFIPFVEEWVNSRYKNANFEISNSGYSVVISMDDVLDLISKFPKPNDNIFQK